MLIQIHEHVCNVATSKGPNEFLRPSAQAEI